MTKWLRAEVVSTASNVKLTLYSRSYRGGVELNLYIFFNLESRRGSVVKATLQYGAQALHAE
jgi:hypothetical protein